MRQQWYAIITNRGALFCRIENRAELFRTKKQAQQIATQYSRYGVRKLTVSRVEWREVL